MNEKYIEQILRNQQIIMSVLYDMYLPITSQNTRLIIVADNANKLVYNIEQTVDLLGRTHNEDINKTNKKD